MLHKFGSNLSFKESGNSVISMNSARGSHLIAGELLTRSGRRRGHPWLHAGTGRLRRGFSLLLSCALRAYVAAILLLFIPLFSSRHRPAPASSCHRRSAIQSQQRRHKLRLLLVLQLTPLEPSQFIRISRAPSSPSRPSAAPPSSTSPWPERSGAYLLLSMVLSSPWYRVAR